MTVPVPRFICAIQHFPDRRLGDLTKEIRCVLASSAIGRHLPSGSRIAVAVGSRGIADLSEIV